MIDNNRIVGQLEANTSINVNRRPAYVICLAVYDDGLDDPGVPNVQLSYSPMERIGEEGPRAKNLHPTNTEMFTAFYLAQSILAAHDPEVQEFLKAQQRAYKRIGSEFVTTAQDNATMREMKRNLRM